VLKDKDLEFANSIRPYNGRFSGMHTWWGRAVSCPVHTPVTLCRAPVMQYERFVTQIKRS